MVADFAAWGKERFALRPQMEGIRTVNSFVRFGLRIRFNVPSGKTLIISLVILASDDSEKHIEFQDDFPSSDMPKGLINLRSFVRREPDLDLMEVMCRCVEILLIREAKLTIVFELDGKTCDAMSPEALAREEVAFILAVDEFATVLTIPLGDVAHFLVPLMTGDDVA